MPGKHVLSNKSQRLVSIIGGDTTPWQNAYWMRVIDTQIKREPVTPKSHQYFCGTNRGAVFGSKRMLGPRNGSAAPRNIPWGLMLGS